MPRQVNLLWPLSSFVVVGGGVVVVAVVVVVVFVDLLVFVVLVIHVYVSHFCHLMRVVALDRSSSPNMFGNLERN